MGRSRKAKPAKGERVATIPPLRTKRAPVEMTNGNSRKCRIYGACELPCVNPALTCWANLYRAYGAGVATVGEACWVLVDARGETWGVTG